jgi:hypothetical protein
MAVPLE